MHFSGSAALALVLGTSLASAQQASTSSNSTTNSLIPSDASPQCQSFMVALNADDNLKSCTTPLLDATSYYISTTNSSASSTNKDSLEATLKESLAKLCGSNTCDSNLIRTNLTNYWDACSAEIQANIPQVRDVYDTLYMINPFKDSICTQDNDGNYCVMTIAHSSSSSQTTSTTTKRSVSEADVLDPRSSLDEGEGYVDDSFLLPRQATNLESTADSVQANSTQGKNPAFLFLSPESDQSVLCSQCAKKILASYISFETSIPYAIGLQNSDVLAIQSSIYKQAKKLCGDTWGVDVNALANTSNFTTIGAASTSNQITKAGIAVSGLVVAALLV
ncbi:hypothetical protein IE53DRAFT_359424 [Violaceomyces palustris]|uniref:Uncharacterized protein n=1 Tax=Violaceomyces palustris TaxID=1673888 RepID=A0ACD0P832_9BASI|nr:hypothetical protein IE53DRAFT_359424 [Violaceomyces palustris]